MLTKLTEKHLKNLLFMLPIQNVQVYNGEINLTIPNEFTAIVLKFLKNHTNTQYKVLSCISCVDYPNKKNRFKLVYELLSIKYNSRLRISILTNELDPVNSASKVFCAANWYESEIWDMFGVFFQNHPNLTRLLTDYGFEGYPLRKDFPLSGFVETSYDFTKKQVLNNKLELSQEYKNLNFNSPWEIIKIK